MIARRGIVFSGRHLMTMSSLWVVLAYVGAIGTLLRFRKWFVNRNKIRVQLRRSPKVSIIIPARDEAANIGRLLRSLTLLDYPSLEIVVVDDRSTDETANIARSFGVDVVSTKACPQGWTGKNWACETGAEAATGEYLLFTDADTVHQPQSLSSAITYMAVHKLSMISSQPYHLNELWWERFIGTFYGMIYCGSSSMDKPSRENPYAIGQYLLLKRSAYDAVGRHAAIRNELADDASLARTVMMHGLSYGIYQGPPLFGVQMYSDFKSFCNGWIRILRLGMTELKKGMVLNTFLPLFALNVSNLLQGRVMNLIPVAVTLLVFLFSQRWFGKFSFVGILFFPIGITLFVTLAVISLIRHLLQLPVVWRGRKYTTATTD